MTQYNVHGYSQGSLDEKQPDSNPFEIQQGALETDGGEDPPTQRSLHYQTGLLSRYHVITGGTGGRGAALRLKTRTIVSLCSLCAGSLMPS